jgi:Tfp pilus assembly protein PilZ
VELRRTPRAPIDVLVEFAIKGGSAERSGGRAKDISLGGMFVETPEVPPFGAEVVVFVILPGHSSPFELPGVVRWTRADGMGVQFRMLGARETHAITEVVRDSEGSEVKF